MLTGQQTTLLFPREKMIKMASMMTESTTHGYATPYGYWMSFVTEWDRLAHLAYEAGQDDMGCFFAELADDAGDVWSGLYGPLGS